MHSDKASWGLKLAAWGGLVFLHFPILVIFLYAFNTEDAAFSFPPKGFTLHWFSVTFARQDVMEAIRLSLQIASIATLIAMLLGTLAAVALYRRDFFGKESISLMLILPIATDGDIPGDAGEAYWRWFGVTAIIDALGTIVTPILALFLRDTRPATPRPGHADAELERRITTLAAEHGLDRDALLSAALDAFEASRRGTIAGG